ncbi:uncharacterized protein LOC136035999 [Artemia franciscana]|uniref:uncharacterized protein LOC136035999 n=1 Tax=Artemia franciscana TaxID=6661 RepID=UPI0032DA213F
MVCKNHVTDRGKDCLWGLSYEAVRSRLESCLALMAAYRQSYHTALPPKKAKKKNLASSVCSEKGLFYFPTSVRCSIHSIFGKMDLLEERFGKLMTLMNILETHGDLLENRIDGLIVEDDVSNDLLRRYNAALKDITDRPYDYLDFRLKCFDHHFSEFKNKLQEIRSHISDCVEKTISEIWNTTAYDRILSKRRRLESLIPFRESESSIVKKVVFRFENDLRKIEKGMKKMPGKPAKFTKHTGKICWLMHLIRSLDEDSAALSKNFSDEIPEVDTALKKAEALRNKLIDAMDGLTLNWYPLKVCNIELFPL